MTNTLTIRTPRGDAVVPAHDRIDGLVIAETSPDRYSITHEASGLGIWPQFDYMRPSSLDAACRALATALASGINWTADVEQIKAQIGDGYRAIAHRMRLAAEPPRRPRWHKGVQRRRLKPYEAQSKAAAIREAAAIGDFGRTMWRELWAYDRRSVGWERLPAVQRQPCRRFGLTREWREVPS